MNMYLNSNHEEVLMTPELHLAFGMPINYFEDFEKQDGQRPKKKL